MIMYDRGLAFLSEKGWISKTDSILVLAGGVYDKESLLTAGFQNVTISNLHPHLGVTEFAPYKWLPIDAERIDLPDNSVDWAVIHAGLHHLGVPAMGVCEMFRVARKGILCMEARDSLCMRAAIALGLTDDHELEFVYLTGGKSGGYRYGPIPNFVYRWTEREFEKIIKTYAPTHRHKFFYLHAFEVPVERLAMARNPLLRAAGFVLGRIARIAELVAPSQGNLFAFGALKNVELQPWLDENLHFRDSYLSKKYDKQKYPGATQAHE